VKQLIRLSSAGNHTDVVVDVEPGEDLNARAKRERMATGDDWALVISAEQARQELRHELCRAKYLLGTGNEVHRAYGEKLRAAAVTKAAALDLDLGMPDGPTEQDMRDAGLV